jgi:hypothetical protein
MMTQAKRNNAILGASWLALGVLLILYVAAITLSGLGQSDESAPMASSPAPMEYTESISNVLVSRESSPRVILEPQLMISQSNLAFKLDESYMVAYEMFKSKTIVSENSTNTKKQFENFLELYGIKLDDNGMLVDVRGSIVPSKLIECHIMGYFPDKPYIKSNCV